MQRIDWAALGKEDAVAAAALEDTFSVVDDGKRLWVARNSRPTKDGIMIEAGDYRWLQNDYQKQGKSYREAVDFHSFVRLQAQDWV